MYISCIFIYPCDLDCASGLRLRRNRPALFRSARERSVSQARSRRSVKRSCKTINQSGPLPAPNLAWVSHSELPRCGATIDRDGARDGPFKEAAATRSLKTSEESKNSRLRAESASSTVKSIFSRAPGKVLNRLGAGNSRARRLPSRSAARNFSKADTKLN